MSSKQDDKVLEMVVFSLKPGVERGAFLEASDAVSAWVAQQPGFISRETCVAVGEDRWIDVLWWRSLHDAKEASDKIMASTSCAAMLGMIEEETTLMWHGEPAAAPVRA